MGGVGNQLFILAAALNQAKRLDCPLYIDVSKYSGKDPREFGLNSLNLPGEIISSNSPWAKIGPYNKFRIPYTDWPLKSRFFREKNPHKYDADINKIKKGTTLVGYFQSVNYFEPISGDIFKLIDSALDAKQQISSQFALHARRGDYLALPERRNGGLTSINYFEKALTRLAAHVPKGTEPLLFSDSPELASNELADIPNLKLFDDSLLNDLQTLVLMSRSAGLIMSNSTFSWWAGWLTNLRGNSPVVAPTPWLPNDTTADSIILEEWIKIPIQ